MRSRTHTRVLAVAAVTLKEATRRRLILVALVMSAGFLALYGLGLHYAATEMAAAGGAGVDEVIQRAGAAQLLYMGLLAAGFMIALAAVFTSAGAVAADVESGVAYAVLARPVRRAEAILGKFLGLCTLLVAYALVFDGLVIGLARWQIGTPVTDWPAALALMALEPVVLVAVALAASTRLPTLAAGILCSAAYGIGFIGGFIEQIGGILGNATMMRLGVVSSLLMPVDALHRAALSLALPGGLLFGQGSMGVGLGESTTPSAWMIVYAAGYVVVMVALAARMFGRRDL